MDPVSERCDFEDQFICSCEGPCSIFQYLYHVSVCVFFPIVFIRPGQVDSQFIVFAHMHVSLGAEQKFHNSLFLT